MSTYPEDVSRSELAAAGERCGGTVYRTERSSMLGSRQIRSARFRVTRFGRRGVDPEEVRRFLGRVADQVYDLHAELAAARSEVNRLRLALRERQAGFPYANERRTGHDRGLWSGTVPQQPRRHDGA